MIMNLLSARYIGKFAVIFSVLLLAASVSFGQSQTTTVQILPFSNYGYINPNYNGQSLTVGKSYSMTAYAKSGFAFTGWIGSQTNSNPKLTFKVTSTNALTFIANFKDKQKPTLAFTAPANNSVLTNSAVIVAGTASDNDMVTKVFCNWISQGSTNPLTVLTGNNLKNWWVNVTLTAGTNLVQAYSVDRTGSNSTTSTLKLIYSTAPAALNGVTITVTNPDSLYVASFNSSTNHTFSDDNGVGSYNYLKTGPTTGKLVLHYIAPPGAINSDTNILQFTNANSGVFSDAGDFTNSFTFATATNLALSAVTGSKIRLTSYDGGTNQSNLTFLSPPLVSGNSNSIATSNPLTIPLASTYPGEIGDRVQVVFNHQHLISGIWYSNAPMTFIGTIVGIGSGTNTVTVLFDIVAYNTHSDVFSPMINTPLIILTYYYTDYTDGNLVTNGTGTFTYTNYSPIGSLLQLTADGTKYFYLLTFTNQSSTNTADTGIFYAEAYVGASLQGTNSGTFAMAAPPLISSQPTSQAVTNGGTATFSVAANGSQPLTYQWQLNGNNLIDTTTSWGSTTHGSTTTNFTIASVATNDIGNYTVVVANGFGTVTSTVAALNVTFELPPQITGWPQANTITVTTGSTTNFYVTATGTAPLAYQWQFENTNLVDDAIFSGSMTTNLTLTSVTTNNTGNYQVVITNRFGSCTSSIVNLQVQ